MIYKFKSQADADVIMLQSNGDQMLTIIGRVPSVQGIVTVAQIPAAIAATTSCFVMRPSLPVPAILAAFTLFSAITFAAAGEGVPFA